MLSRIEIIYKETFVNRLEKQLQFIAKDDSVTAKKFKKDLILKIKSIPNNPLLFRKSIYFDNSEIRDLIFKGYTIVFRINRQTIEVFGLVSYREKPTD